jgi:hypothetical protein
MSQFRVKGPAPGYWRVVYANPPINPLNSTTVVELCDLVSRIEKEPVLRVVVADESPPGSANVWRARPAKDKVKGHKMDNATTRVTTDKQQSAIGV